jgi:energy-coupling factor transporter ATP-binding protein EcfA2
MGRRVAEALGRYPLVMSQASLPFGDHPIEAADQDVLGRNALANALAEEIAEFDVSRGAVAAITGAWGSGKTSLMNMTAEKSRAFEGIRVLEFNPWLYSSTNELAETFLSELAAQLRDLEKFDEKARRVGANIAEAIADYSQSLNALRFIPGAGGVQEAVEGLARQSSALMRGDTSLTARRSTAINALSQLDGRIIVLVDDIDRLTRTEIRQLFRTVRLIASFPNVVYLLCLDRDVVEKALDEEGFSGRAYLEKILTITCTVPVPDEATFRRAYLAALDDVLNTHITAPLSEERFWRVQMDILRPLIRTMRDAKRMLASLPIPLRLIRDEVAIADLIALEALRTLAPELHELLDECAPGLTTTSPIYGGREPPELAQQVKRFVDADLRGGSLARAVVEVLFPAGARHLGGASWATGSEAQWEMERRVAASTVLEVYLTRQLAAGAAPAAQVTQVAAVLGDPPAARAVLDRVEDARLENLLERLLPFIDRAEADIVPGAVEVLLELFGRLRTGSRGIYDFGAEFAISRPVLRLLQRVSEEQVYDLSARLVSTTESIFAAFELVSIVGHREGTGHKLVSEERALELEQTLAQRVRDADAERLADERSLTRVLFHVLRPPEETTELALPILSDSRVASAVFRDAVATAYGQTAGSPVVRKSHSLHWDILVRLFGGESTLSTVADSVEEELRARGADADEQLAPALGLIKEYLKGWRPNLFGHDV